MKLKIFQSDKGDCLLLEGKSKHLVLCDGGMGPSMRNHVRDELAKLRKANRPLSLVYVSHVDNDHISGVLQLLQDEADWRVYEHHNKKKNNPVTKPTVPRPPVIKGILHNAFRDQITANKGPLEDVVTARAIENLLGSMAPALFGTAVPDLMDVADDMQAIATGIPEAIKVSKLIAADALDIPLNQPPGVDEPAQLLFAGRPGEHFKLGSMEFTLIGPTEDELEKLREGWINWLRRNKEQAKKLRAELKRRIEDFSTGALVDSPFDLREWEGIPDYKGVSTPNVASLMFMVEEDGKRLLLTGDGQQDIILAGLERTGFLEDGTPLQIDVLKVQHHGSENNMDDQFAGRVLADHYVFCGNGEHGNPDLGVLDIVFNSRTSDDAPFHFWFSTTSDAQAEGTKKREHFREVEHKARKLEAKAHGRLKLHFNDDAWIELRI